ncbi:hypothetical protein K0M31_008748 [Melipona bicolor]|uniref:Uncharacterized protein n=1 Tax=Melipona bicolor TaxID=60889 RepID=A0AA40FQF3_9HYME|nr:hypothetical protein K0M31_008748 [Melipona bicolor]
MDIVPSTRKNVNPQSIRNTWPPAGLYDKTESQWKRPVRAIHGSSRVGRSASLLQRAASSVPRLPSSWHFRVSTIFSQSYIEI